MRAPRQILQRRWGATVLAAMVAVAVSGAGYAVDAVGESPESDVLGPGTVTVPLEIEHSVFSTDRIRVRAGTLVRFEVDNRDPIHHELVVGPPEVHERHERGTELAHPPVPGEVSVGPNAAGMTFARFDTPGEVAFACHLPGHVAYGMVGTVEVVP